MMRIATDHGELVKDPLLHLEQSDIIQRYTQLKDLKPLGKIFALIGLSEIPYTEQLPFTQELITFVNQYLATPDGFSYTGKSEEIVPCYNALLFEAYCRLGLGHSKEAQSALNWIKQYQVFERNQKTSWPHKGICKFGGCMKKVPCFIGIGKTVRALLTYQDLVDANDEKVNEMIRLGLEYMLQHNLFRRRSNGQPISAHITENMVPQSYHLSLTDLAYIVEKGKCAHDSRVKDLQQLIYEKKTRNGGWKIDYIYKYSGYVPFDNRRRDSEWLNYLCDVFQKT